MAHCSLLLKIINYSGAYILLPLKLLTLFWCVLQSKFAVKYCKQQNPRRTGQGEKRVWSEILMELFREGPL